MIGRHLRRVNPHAGHALAVVEDVLLAGEVLEPVPGISRKPLQRGRHSGGGGPELNS
jgi:hypothetical protein